MPIKSLLVKTTLIACVLFLLLSCAGSSVQVIGSEIEPRPESIVYILPFGLPESEDIEIAQDWRKTGVTITTKEGEVIQKGMYQYSFAEGDINILRNSLVSSLKASNSFRDVIYLRTGELNTLSNQSAFYIDVKINSTGMASGNVLRCFILGDLIIKNENNTILFTDEIVTESKSLMTISDAKNKAIKQFVDQVIQSFNQF